MLDIDKSWNPIKGLLNEKFLNLPNTQYLPEKKNIFNVFKMPISEIKIVILGQDPYPTQGYAMGYAFAVPADKEMPKSLRVIKKEINNDEDPNWQTLKHWRDCGVFLLNTALTVERNKPGSHLAFWKDFTNQVIEYISKTHPCIWMLWGRKAQKFKNIIKEGNKKNHILEAPHPAARGNGFHKCGHKNFLEANKILGKNKIIW
ncbi:MAG: uracil-DNA glycosylase [Fibromonadaceae bacterium]|jgi:uracil-DNA glycosylase|nr:uracil-DNA glycosylase [Fibromonadaceae bacterium]